MKKSRKNKSNKNKKKNKTIKHKHKHIIIPSITPTEIEKVSNKIAKGIFMKERNLKSYSPTINQDLVTLKSIPRQELKDCNIKAAFQLKQPLEIGIPQNFFSKKCFNYNTSEAKKFLLKNLSADKHVDIRKIVPPIQSQANCWFNAMFVTFFVSDKGRKFFHFLRQLMIEGIQKDGQQIPQKIRDAFALLNFGIDACLTGNQFAYELDTNSIIHLLYKNIPTPYKLKYPYIVDVDEAGNPLLYYISIINYLNNSSIILLFIRDANNQWKDKVTDALKKMKHLPHIIVLEAYDETAGLFNKKPVSFSLNEAKYAIDSAVVRDITKQHFCSTITCEKKQMGYDGMSFHRIVPMDWKEKLNNKDFYWQFEGTKDHDGTPLEWNFMKCYQLLMYYRTL
jgi:hypothetical protein